MPYSEILQLACFLGLFRYVLRVLDKPTKRDAIWLGIWAGCLFNSKYVFAAAIVGAGALIIFGLYKLLAPMSHPRWVGMRVNFRDLTAWSFLMSTAHGAGLMLMPILLRLSPVGVQAADSAAHADHAGHAAHMQMASAVAAPTTEFAAVATHSVAMFLVMAAIAVVVFEKIGLAILRRAWVNLDLIWAVALIATGALSLML